MVNEELIVRTATIDDLDDIMNIALQACRENGLGEPNPTKLLADIWPALNLDKGIIGVVSKPGGKPEGVVLLRIGEMWYRDVPVLEERAVFVPEEYRAAKGGRARKLCEFSKKVADDLGMQLNIGILSDQRTEAKVKLYRRIFGEPRGAYFVYNAPATGSWSEG